MPFFTRPNFEDRQIVQRNGDTITLSGETNIDTSGQFIIKGVTLDFTGTTTASTLYTVAGVSGYINQGNVSGLKIEPPILLISGSTGTTTVDVTGYYLGGLDQYGSVVWVPPFTGTTSGKCLTELCIDGNVLIKEILSLLKDMYVNDIRFGRGEGNWVSNTTVGKDSLTSNTTGQYLTAMGKESLMSNTTGDYNSAFGYKALSSVSNGDRNIAFGSQSLELLNSSDNIAIGYQASQNATTALFTIAIGSNALLNNNNDYNIAIGHNTLTSNTSGYDNTGVGYDSLSQVSIGAGNTALGSNTLNSTTLGDGNVAIGVGAGASNITGQYNTFLGGGSDCLVNNLSNATAVGNGAVVSQSNTVILGNGSDVGINTSAPTSKLHVIGTNGYNQFRMETSYTPTGSTDSNGNVGDVAWDNNNIYIKTAPGVWKRAGLSTF